MEIKLRPVPNSNTWYDFKMAVAGTLIDYGLYLRMKGSKRDVVTVYRNGMSFRDPAAIAYEERKYISWEVFYSYVLPKIIMDNEARKQQEEQERKDIFQKLRIGKIGERIENTCMSALPVGTMFYVNNGNWKGSIIELDGVKHVQVEGEVVRRYIAATDDFNDLEVYYPVE